MADSPYRDGLNAAKTLTAAYATDVADRATFDVLARAMIDRGDSPALAELLNVLTAMAVERLRHDIEVTIGCPPGDAAVGEILAHLYDELLVDA